MPKPSTEDSLQELVGVVVQEEVLGDGTGQRLLHHS